MVFKIAFANTGSDSMLIMYPVNLISCQKNTIHIIAEITLNRTWPTANCLFEDAPHSEAMTHVIVVPILDPITIAIDAGNQIIHDHKAAKVITLIAELDWIIKVTTAHISQKPRKDMSLYWARSKLALIASTLSFINPIQMKRSQNHTSNFPIHILFSLLPAVSIRIHHSAIIGSANEAILNSQNPRYDTKMELTVVHTFAQIITQILFCKLINHAHKNPRSNKVTRLLLCNTAVTTVHIDSDFTAPFVYFSK